MGNVTLQKEKCIQNFGKETRRGYLEHTDVEDNTKISITENTTGGVATRGGLL